MSYNPARESGALLPMGMIYRQRAQWNPDGDPMVRLTIDVRVAANAIPALIEYAEASLGEPYDPEADPDDVLGHAVSEVVLGSLWTQAATADWAMEQWNYAWEVKR